MLLPDLSSEIASVASEKSQLDGLLSIRHVTQTLLTAAYKFDVLKKQRDAEAVVKAAFPKVLSIVGNGAVETGAAREIEVRYSMFRVFTFRPLNLEVLSQDATNVSQMCPTRTTRT